MDIVVPSARGLCIETLGEAAAASETAQPCRINLQHAGSIDPAGLIAIAVTAECAIDQRREVEFAAPKNAGVRHYVSQMQLPEVLAALGVTKGEWRSFPQREPDSELAGLHAFRSETELIDVAERIVGVLASIDPGLVQPLYNAVVELGLNTVQHSKRDGVGNGYVAAQISHRAQDVVFAVGDAGRGIRPSLAETTSVRSDRAALQLAARKHVSSEAAAGRGRGITGVIETTGRHRGNVVIASGDALGVFSGGHWDPQVSHLNPRFPGTVSQTRLAFEGRLRR